MSFGCMLVLRLYTPFSSDGFITSGYVVLRIMGNTNRSRSGVAVLVVLTAILILSSAPVAANSITSYEDPDLVPNVEGENVVEPGETVTLQVAVQNRGSYTGKARAAPGHLSGLDTVDTPGTTIGTVAEFSEGSAPVDIRTGAQKVGAVGQREPAFVSLTFEVDDDAGPGTYEIPVEFEYEYIRIAISDDRGGEKRDFQVIRKEDTEEESIEIRVEETVDLEVLDVRGEGLRAGDDGRLTATVMNDGHETANNARLNFVSSEQFTARDASKHVGDLAPDGSATADFRVSVAESYAGGESPVKMSLEYEDENDVTKETSPETGSVGVAGDVEFSVDAEAEEMYVDSVGAVHATVTNTGETTVENARFVLRENPPFQPVSRRSSLGTLAPGESAEASFRVEVSDRAVAQSYPVEGHVEYQDIFDETRTSSSVINSVEIGPERDIDVTGSPTVSAGATETVEFEVENTGGGTMYDAVARINVDSPFSTSDDTTYVGDLEPGESATVSYRVSVDSGATAKEYSVDLVAKYDNAFGDNVVTDVRKAPVEVEEGGGILGWIFGLLR